MKLKGLASETRLENVEAQGVVILTLVMDRFLDVVFKAQGSTGDFAMAWSTSSDADKPFISETNGDFMIGECLGVETSDSGSKYLRVEVKHTDEKGNPKTTIFKVYEGNSGRKGAAGAYAERKALAAKKGRGATAHKYIFYRLEPSLDENGEPKLRDDGKPWSNPRWDFTDSPDDVAKLVKDKGKALEFHPKPQERRQQKPAAAQAPANSLPSDDDVPF
jgi:hypothetical protein